MQFFHELSFSSVDLSRQLVPYSAHWSVNVPDQQTQIAHSPIKNKLATESVKCSIIYLAASKVKDQLGYLSWNCQDDSNFSRQEQRASDLICKFFFKTNAEI